MIRLAIFIVLYLITTQLLAIEPSWCSSNRLNYAERFICSKSSLWEVENRLVDVFNQVSNSLSGSKKRNLRRKQTRWLRKRNSRCRYSVNKCLQVYETRIDYLESLNKIYSEDQAVEFIHKHLVQDKRYNFQCLQIIVEETSKYFDIALHEKHSGNCPGDPNTAPIVDRFRVFKNGKILWHDFMNGDYISDKMRRKYYQKY